MATPVGRIEKEFLLQSLFDEKIPIMYIKDRNEVTLFVDKRITEELILRNNKPVGNLKPKQKLPLLFNFHGRVIDFQVEVITQREDLIFCKVPEMLYKNLDRNYLRVDTPSDLNIIFTYRGDRYNLLFPKVPEYETVEINELERNMDPQNLSDIIKQITQSLKNIADGFKIVIFKDKKPETTEELIVSTTGKTLFIQSTSKPLPAADPYPRKRIITEELFKKYLASSGTDEKSIDETLSQFMKKKAEDGIISDAWVPILFHEYVIGYIHVWIEKAGHPPFDFKIHDNIYQYTKALAFSLKESGYFDHGRMKNEPFEGRVLDISASGLLFAHRPDSSLMSTLLIDAELTVTIEAPYRTISVVAKIVRKFNDKTASYFGCRFLNMVPEDTRFLFEHLYGRQIDSEDTEFLAGQV